MKKEEKVGVPLNFKEQLAVAWFLIDAGTHLTIELAYVWLALTTTAEKTDSFFGYIWREYGRADARWAVRDANVISLEIATVILGVVCLFQVYGIVKRKSWRHVLQVIICVAELYGGWMTFAPEWIEGNPNLNGSDPVLLWIYLFFMNGLWVVLPGILLWDSCARLSHACTFVDSPLDSGFPSGAPALSHFFVAAGFILLYIVLVPAVLLSAEGVPVKN